MIQTFQIAPANVHDLRMLDELTESDIGILLTDRAYLSQPIKEQLFVKQGLELSVPTKYGQPCPLNPE